MAEAASPSHDTSGSEHTQHLGDAEVPEIPPPYREIQEVLISTDNRHAVRIEIEDHSTLNLRRNEHGHTTLHMAAARTLASVSDILEDRTASEAVILLSDKTPTEGWTSLHISTIKNNSDVVEYILDKIPDEEQRRRFIDEVDRELGWTSLQWGAASDRVESVQATMDRMSLSHQQEVMICDWTLLHATAKFDAVKTMKSLMQRVELNDEDKWRILTCPVSDGKTALHIAVVEGNVRAAIMLLDLAGDSQSLATQRDESRMKARFYSDSFPLFGEYLSLAEVAFEGPVIHMAAEKEDWQLVSWILDKYPDQKLEVINRRDFSGSTALHVASAKNRPLVIREISKQLSEEEFMSSMNEANGDGKTAIHLAVTENCPASVHALLKAIDNDDRNNVLLQRNQAEEYPIQVAEKMEHHDVARILKYHHMILSNGLSAFFHQFEYSLFSRHVPDDALKTRYKRMEDRKLDDRGLKRHVNFDATTCILHEDMEQAEALTALAVKVDGDNMHTWCNRGILQLQEEEIDEAEKSAFRVLELMASSSVTCQLRPKIEFAYWMAEVLRTEQARDECCELMQECEVQVSNDSAMQEYLSYCFVKILIRHLRSDDKYGKPREWYHEKLYRVVDQLILLSQSENDEHKADMWLWLAELQYLTDVPYAYLLGPLETFSAKTKIMSVDRESCYKKVMELDKKGKLEAKMRARIAKNCLDIAYNCKEDPRQWYMTAVEMSKKWMEDNHWVLMCASTCAQGLYNLWAIEFYEKHSDLVGRKYKQLNGRSLDSSKVAWKFLTTYFYSAEISSDATTRKYLEEAKEHLARIMDRVDGWATHGVKYARIKFLLGDPSVEQLFIKAISVATSDVRRAKALEQFGCYYFAMESFDQAKFHFREAIETGNTSAKGYRAGVARKYLKCINKAQTPRRHNRY